MLLAFLNLIPPFNTRHSRGHRVTTSTNLHQRHLSPIAQHQPNTRILIASYSQQTMFTVFSRLPIEIRLKIWAVASNQSPRTIDIWTDFKRCEIENTIFYTQWYSSSLALINPPPILSVSKEAREEALKHYVLEFETHMTIPKGISVVMQPRFYINYASDTLLPRGYWNIVSFADFYSRAERNGLKSLAIDVCDSFWTENLRDYVAKGAWVFNGLEELLIYDVSGKTMWKESRDLEKFKKRYKGGPRDLGFMELQRDEEMSDALGDTEKCLQAWFDRIEGLAPEAEEGKVVEVQQPSRRSYLDAIEVTTPEEFLRPSVRVMKLLATKRGSGLEDQDSD